MHISLKIHVSPKNDNDIWVLHKKATQEKYDYIKI